MKKLFQIHQDDNVAVALCALPCGTVVDGITLRDNIPRFHKVALSDIPAGEKVIKYGNPIGSAAKSVRRGEWVHTHNLQTNLTEEPVYRYDGDYVFPMMNDDATTIRAYPREDGNIGIRNEIWIIPTVGCVNQTAEKLAAIGNTLPMTGCDGVYALTHPYGCSQMGGDHHQTQKLLAALAKHPNAGGVLLVSLGCENNNLKEFLPLLGEIDPSRVKTLVCQECEDELAQGKELLEELLAAMKNDRREPVPLHKLVIGFKCGGSDALSGITANPLCGILCDRHTLRGGKALLTEVPEMFGAEHLLMKRCVKREVFEATEKLLLSYKEYFALHGEVCYENPSPGNREGGITTLEEKSLGCIQKGGSSPVTQVLGYAERKTLPGLNLLWGPGNDIVSATNLMAAGAHLILFTTGRGTPLGTFVPTLKIASNTALAEKKRNWIDFDAQRVLTDGFRKTAESLYQLVIDVAEGAATKNEENHYRQIAIFKDGVTM